MTAIATALEYSITKDCNCSQYNDGMCLIMKLETGTAIFLLEMLSHPNAFFCFNHQQLSLIYRSLLNWLSEATSVVPHVFFKHSADC